VLLCAPSGYGKSVLLGQWAAEDQELVAINTDTRPPALQIALLVPLNAGLAGFANSFRMARVPSTAPPKAAASAALG